jgi:hypothetical protein
LLFLPEFHRLLVELKTPGKLSLSASTASSGLPESQESSNVTTPTTTTSFTTTTETNETTETTETTKSSNNRNNDTNGETKQQTQIKVETDENGCIINPIKILNNQLHFGDILQLKQINEFEWKKNRNINSSWSTVNPSLFMLRGKNYMYDKKKQPSDFAIYTPIGVDILTTNKRYFDLSSKIFYNKKIPAETTIGGMPTKLTIEITFPIFDAENAMWGKQVHDGQSHVWVCTFVLSKEAISVLNSNKPLSAGFLHAKNFLSKNDPYHGCLKTIFQLANVDDSAVSAALGFTGRTMIRNYNGKPYLSNNSHRMRRVS